MSYLHASWERQEDIERVDPQAKMKIKRFMQAPQAKGILGMKVSNYHRNDLIAFVKL